jgi:hypothetical protein
MERYPLLGKEEFAFYKEHLTIGLLIKTGLSITLALSIRGYFTWMQMKE